MYYFFKGAKQIENGLGKIDFSKEKAKILKCESASTLSDFCYLIDLIQTSICELTQMHAYMQSMMKNFQGFEKEGLNKSGKQDQTIDPFNNRFKNKNRAISHIATTNNAAVRLLKWR